MGSEPSLHVISAAYVQLAIPQGGENRAREFYVGVLGFKELPKPEKLAKRGGAWFRSGDVTLHVGVDETFTPQRKLIRLFGASTIRHSLIVCAEAYCGDV